MKWTPALAIVLALGAACERPGERTAERELAAKVLSGVLAYPQSTLAGVSAGEDAAQATFTTPAPLPRVTAWYREALRLNGWQVRTDQLMADGSIAMYADSGRRPLWITQIGRASCRERVEMSVVAVSLKVTCGIHDHNRE